MIKRLNLEGFARGLKGILEENLTFEMAESVAEKLLSTTHPSGLPLAAWERKRVVDLLREGESRPLGKQLTKWLMESRFCQILAPSLHRWYVEDTTHFDMVDAIDIIDTFVAVANWSSAEEDSEGHVMHSYNQGFFDLVEVAQKVGTQPRKPASDEENTETKGECYK